MSKVLVQLHKMENDSVQQQKKRKKKSTIRKLFQTNIVKNVHKVKMAKKIQIKCRFEIAFMLTRETYVCIVCVCSRTN